MGRSSTSFRRGEGGRIKGCKNKTTLLAERLGLTYEDINEISYSILEKLKYEISRLPMIEQIKSWCIVFEFFVGKQKTKR